MKAFFLGLFLASSAAHAAPVLSEIEQEDLLRAIDNICGDTWCEGDSNWSFDAIACDSDKGCVLDLTMKPYDFDEDQVLQSRPFQCALPDFTTKERLVENTIRGLQYTQELYDAVSDCINNLTDHYGPIYVPIDNKCESLFGPKSQSFVYMTSSEIHASGVYGAIEAVSQIVYQRSKVDATCELTREPYYRDSASCETVSVGTETSQGKGDKSSLEICTLPTVNGSFIVSTDDAGLASVEYRPGKKGSDAYKDQNKNKPKPNATRNAPSLSKF